MKTRNLQSRLAVAAAGCVALWALNASAQGATGTNAPPPLSVGAADVVKLAQAKVSDSTIIAFVRNSGHAYNLDATQLLYLRQQGVSDAVLAVMLNQPKPAEPPPATTQTAPAAASTPPPVPANERPATAYVAPAPAAATYVPPPVTYYYDPYYYYAPYYYPAYYGWPYPAVSFSFGWGGHWGGGWHGGGVHGGGAHGGEVRGGSAHGGEVRGGGHR